MRKNGIVYGHGINDIGSVENIEKEYKLWQGIIRRCYSEKDQTIQRNTSYIGCKVSQTFLRLSSFCEWCNSQIGFGNVDENGKSWQLDKDILFKGNKLYSEDTCCFVPQEINRLLTGSIKTKRDLPVGVHFQKRDSLFVAQCSNSENRQILLGYFKTVDEAFKTYKVFKESIIKSKVAKWESYLDPLVSSALLKYEVG